MPEIPEKRFLRKSQVIERCGMPRSSLYKQIKSGTFPRPDAYLSPQLPVWLETTIAAWIDKTLAAATPAKVSEDMRRRHALRGKGNSTAAAAD